ncbi:DUF190 domain-containing protein [Chloroflexus sp.]|uniref:DUF190 domain-containing protein n=1 Tax=Chloroflexus sp. TaxID=1904827 RepID=UPI002ACEB1E7|nr:DUF190 domain-containing protein [Chloroflexus sp.]
MAEPTVQRVRIYLNGEDRAGDRPLYQAVLAELRQSGATGATALPALTGFGPRRQVLPDVERQPVIIEWIDQAARIRRILPLIGELAGNALITLEPVEVAQGVLRPGGPFGAEQLVSDLMQTDATGIAYDAPLLAALEHIATAHAESLAVVQNKTVIGMVSARELVWRGGLRLPPSLLGVLEPAESAAALAALQGRTVGEIANREVRGVSLTTPIPQALAMMIEWGYAQVPVLDAQGRLAGMFGQREVLLAAARQPEPVDAANVGVRVGMVMQAATARVALGQPLATALAMLITAPGHLLFVVDSDGRLAGILRLSNVLKHLQGDERNVLLAAVQRSQPTPAAALPGARRVIDDLIEPAPAAVAFDAGLGAAARQLLNVNAERLPVVDSEGRLSGIITRGALVRALLQQSE